MYTLGELADELNRQEWAVEKMLKNRGYLKNNGTPRKSTIDDGLMNKNGLIKEAGWSVFIGELGYKDSKDDDDEIDEENNEDNEDEDDVDEYDEDTDEDDDMLENKIRDALSSEISEESLLQDLSSQLIDLYNHDLQEDDEDWDEDWEINFLCGRVIQYSSQGHTDVFLRTLVSDYETFANDDVDATYGKMNDDEIFDDIESTLKASGYNKNTIDWAREEGFIEFCNIFSLCDGFEKIFNEAMEKGNDEDISFKYARQRMITDDIGFGELPSYPTSLELCKCDEYEEVSNWIEEKYQVNVVDLDLDNNVVFFEHDDLIYKGSINYVDEELEIKDYYLPSDKQDLGL